MSKTLYVGIDVSQDSLDIAVIRSDSKNKPKYLCKVANKPEEFDGLLATIKQEMQSQGCEEVKFILEPTGGYEQRFARWLCANQLPVSLPNPGHVKTWAKSENYRQKTDKVDAKILARYGRDKQPPAWKPLSPEYQQLDDLLKWKEDLENDLQRAENRLHAVQSRGDASAKLLKERTRQVNSLKHQLAKTIKEIETLTKSGEMKEQRKALLAMDGVGEVLTPVLLVELARYSQMTDNQGDGKGLVAFMGLDPLLHESGASVYKKKGISKQGNKRFRSLLYMATLGGLSNKKDPNSPLVQFYKRLLARNKNKKLAILACCRKSLMWAWAVFRDKKPFDPALARSKN